MLENKEPLPSEASAAIEKLKSDLAREHFSRDDEINNPKNNELNFHDRAVGILEMNRERMIKELVREIKRISWLDENELEDAGIVKRIPEIGQDLRSGAIKKMLVERYKVIPGTQVADDKMNELYEIWARQWMEALEAEKKPKKSADIAEVSPSPLKTVEKKEEVSGYVWPKEERDPVKAMALHTFVNLPTFEDVNAETAEKGGEKVNRVAKKVWGAPTVHGFLDPEHPDPETGKPSIARRTDLDGRGYLAILKKAGLDFDMKDVGYVKQGDIPESGKGLLGDTGGEDGVVAKNFGELLISDHHGDKSGRNTSATRNKYEALVADGTLERSEALDAFVEFVTKEDNKDYTVTECKEIIGNFDGNLIGLQKYMTGDQVIKVFEEYAEKGETLDPYEKLSDKYLKTLNFVTPGGESTTLKEVLQKLLNTKNALQREVSKLNRERLVIETEQYGSVLIDKGRMDKNKRKKRLGSNLALEAARAAGYGGVIWWNPEANSFSIQVANKDIDFSLPEGKNHRGRYWLKSPSEEKLQTTLDDILGKMKQITEKVIKPRKKELTFGQKKTLGEIENKFPFQDVENNIEKEFQSGLAEEEKEGRIKNRKTSLAEAKKALRTIASDFSEADASFFRDNFMDQVLAYYRAEKEKVRGLEKIKKIRNQTIGFIKDNAAKNGFNEKSVRVIEDYFRSIFSIEFLANNSK